MRKTSLQLTLNNVEVRTKKIHLVLEMSEQTTITPTRFFAIFIEVEEPSFLSQIHRVTLCQLTQFIFPLTDLNLIFSPKPKTFLSNKICLWQHQIQDLVHFLYQNQWACRTETISTIATPKISAFETSKDLIFGPGNFIFFIRLTMPYQAFDL